MDGAVLVDDYIASLGAERGLSLNTRSAYRRDLRQYLTHLADRGVSGPLTATPSDIESLIVDMRERGWAASTQHRKLAAVRGLHRYLIAEDLSDADPTARIDTPSVGASLPKALSVTDVEAILEAPDPSTPAGLRDRAILEVMYAGGLRVSETVGLEVTDIDTETRTALVTGKGSKQRLVPLGRHAIDAVSAYLPVRIEMKQGRDDSGWLFLNQRGGRLTRQGIFLIIKKHALTAGIAPDLVSPHVLRHSAATHMVEGGADLRTVQEMLGHASISTTQIYTRVSPQHAFEVFVTSHPRAR